MANAYIREYSAVTNAINGAAQAPEEPALVSQTKAFTASAASNAFNANTRLIWVRVDAAANINVGPAPTATAADYPQLQPNKDYFFGVQGGHKIAFYDGAS